MSCVSNPVKPGVAARLWARNIKAYAWCVAERAACACTTAPMLPQPNAQ